MQGTLFFRGDQLMLWFQEPHVKQWWPTPEEKEKFFEHFLQRIRSKDTFAFMVFMDGNPLGYIQYYYIDKTSEKTGLWLPSLPEYTVGIDQFIGEKTAIGKGYGPLLIKEFISYLASNLEPSLTTVIVDPEPDNGAAIRCYEKIGFNRVGIFHTSYGEALLMQYDVIKK